MFNKVSRPSQRIIAYIDGYNLYFGLKNKGWSDLYWLNIQELMKMFMLPYQSLECCKYFTSRVSGEANKSKRQNAFIEALLSLDNFNVYYGQFTIHPYKCPSCNVENFIAGEKMTDVNIAVEMLSDAFFDKFDVAFLVSGDSDLSAPIQSIKKHFPDKKIIVLFPPERKSKELSTIATGYKHIGRDKLEKCQFPETVKSRQGYNLMKPHKWKEKVNSNQQNKSKNNISN